MGELERLIEKATFQKTGDKDFALFRLCDSAGECRWIAEIGNTSPYVMLGESEGEYRGEGVTAAAAVSALIENIVTENRNAEPYVPGARS